MSAATSNTGPAFSYAQAAKGLTPSTPAQTASKTEGAAAPEQNSKDRPPTELPGHQATARSPKSRIDAGDKLVLEASLASKPPPTGSPSSSKDSADKENAPPNPRPRQSFDGATLTPGVSTSTDLAQTAQRGADEASGRRPSIPGDHSPGRERVSNAAEKEKSKDVDDDWDKVSVPSVAAEKELKAAPIPTVNVWQQRREAQEARMRELATQRTAATTTSQSGAKPTVTPEEGKRKATNKDQGTSERDGPPAQRKISESAKGNNRKEPSPTQSSRPVSQVGEKHAPPPVGDTHSWPTPEIATLDERRKSSIYEKAEKPDAKGNGPKSHGNKWVQIPFVPTAKFETQLPPAAARRGGRANTRGRDGAGRGGHSAHTANPTEKNDSTAGSMGPPAAPKQAGEQDRGRKSDGNRGPRHPSVSDSGRRPVSSESTAPNFRKPSTPASKERSVADSSNATSLSQQPNGDERAGGTERSSRSSSRHEGAAAGNGVNGDAGLRAPLDQSADGYGTTPNVDQTSRANYSQDRLKSSSAPSVRGNGDSVRDRNAPRNREWARDNKPESAREKVESWRDRENVGESGARRDTRAERGRGGYRGRGNHSYSGSAFGTSHAFTSPLPQNGFDASRAGSHSDSRSRQSSQPFASNQPASTGRNNPRSQSIPLNIVYPGYYNGVPGLPQALSPLQTDMQMYGFPSPMQMQPGIMSAMPYNDPLNSYALMSMVMTQVEYYFSIDNLCKDLFLRKNMDAQGYVPLSVIANFKRIKALTEDNLDMLRYVCQQVKDVEFLPGIDGDDRLRRRDGWKDFVLPTEERFPSARTEGPSINAQQPRGPANLESIPSADAPFGPAIRSPPFNFAAVNGSVRAASPLRYPQISSLEEQGSDRSFLPRFDNGPHEHMRRPSATSHLSHDQGSVRSPPPHNSIPFNGVVNGHGRHVSRSQQDENVFPDENIPHINIRMQPIDGGNDGEYPPMAGIARIGSNESGSGRSLGGDGPANIGSARVLGLRGGAASPQQLEQFRRVSLGISALPPPVNENGIIYFAKDGLETHLPPPGPGQFDQTYQSLHDTAFQQRSQGMEGALEPLYSFWADFLVDKFNVGMYQEFKSTALHDLEEGKESGSKHLLRYYEKLLGGSQPLTERIASDLVGLTRHEHGTNRPIFHMLRTAWRNGATNLKTIKRLGDFLTAEEKAELDKSG